MEDKMNFTEPIFERAEEYGKTSYKLFKLKAVDKTAEVVSTFISRAAVLLVHSMFILILTVGVALWLGDLLGKLYYGFFCVAGFYALIGGVLYFFMHNFIKRIISNSIITNLLN